MIEGFREAIAQAGLTPPKEIVPDGRWHRFATNGKRDDMAGFYRLHLDGAPVGIFGDWRSGLKQTWIPKATRPLTKRQRDTQAVRLRAMQAQRQREDRQRQARAADQALTQWKAARPAPDNHPYLILKQVRAHGLRIDAHGRLIVPVMIANTLASLQFIGADGAKKFLPGGAVKGGAFTLGEPTNASTILLCEGYATAASLHESTGFPVVTGFGKDNLLPIARIMRTRYSDAKLIVCGDHDKDGGGQARATSAATAVNGLVVIPKQEGDDWNDVCVMQGLDAVKQAIDAGATPHAGILDDLYAFLGRFIAYPSEYAHVAHTLWIVHTHLMDSWESTPRICFLSPEPSSGKTRALELTETVVPRPVEAVNVSPAYLFRKVSDPHGLPTILFDEIDTVFGPKAKENEEIRGLLNAGHRRGATAGRCVVKGKIIETEELPAFCAVALAGLGNLPDTILSRSVIIRMRRRAPSEHVEPYRRRIHAPEGHRLRDRLAAWTASIRTTLNPYPAMPTGLADRPADVWEALLSVADAAGGRWPTLARVSAVSLVSLAMGGQGSLGVLLLQDLQTLFGDREAVWTEDIIIGLNLLEESPWGDLKGKPLDSRRLARFLRPYGIESTQVRIGEKNQKGYTRESLHDAWLRYLPKEQPDTLPPPPIVSDTRDTSDTPAPDAPVNPMTPTGDDELVIFGEA